MRTLPSLILSSLVLAACSFPALDDPSATSGDHESVTHLDELVDRGSTPNGGQPVQPEDDEPVDPVDPVDPVPSSGAFGAPISYATGNDPESIVTADFNDDGRPDFAVANLNDQGWNINNLGSVTVLLATSTGTLQPLSPVAVGYGPVAIATGDFDRDGTADLVTANMAHGMGGNLSVLLGNGDGTFAAAIPTSACCSPWGVAVGDLDGDGNPDLVVSNYQAVQVLRGDGTGHFAAPASYAAPLGGVSIALADLDADGKLDAVLGLGSVTNQTVVVMRGNGNGTLQAAVSHTAAQGGMTLVVADLDRDQVPDVVTANHSASNVSVLRGLGGATFAAPQHHASGRMAVGVVASDLDGDGKPDMAVANADDNSVSVFLGNGDGTMQPAQTYPTGSAPFGVVSADIDGDGRADLVTVNAGSDTVTVLRGSP